MTDPKPIVLCVRLWRVLTTPPRFKNFVGLSISARASLTSTTPGNKLATATKFSNINRNGNPSLLQGLRHISFVLRRVAARPGPILTRSEAFMLGGSRTVLGLAEVEGIG